MKLIQKNIYKPMTDLHHLLTRGVHDIVPRKSLEAKLKTGKPLRVYMGIDATSTRIHLGNAVPLRKLSL